MGEEKEKEEPAKTSKREARSAAATGGVAKVVAPRRKRAPAGEPAAAVSAGGDGGSCYIHLRSRMLFMAPPQPQPPSVDSVPTPAEAADGAAGQQGAALAAGLSRCSSTASSVHVGGQRGSHTCRSDDAAEVRERERESQTLELFEFKNAPRSPALLVAEFRGFLLVLVSTT